MLNVNGMNGGPRESVTSQWRESVTSQRLPGSVPFTQPPQFKTWKGVNCCEHVACDGVRHDPMHARLTLLRFPRFFNCMDPRNRRHGTMPSRPAYGHAAVRLASRGCARWRDGALNEKKE